MFLPLEHPEAGCSLQSEIPLPQLKIRVLAFTFCFAGWRSILVQQTEWGIPVGYLTFEGWEHVTIHASCRSWSGFLGAM